MSKCLLHPHRLPFHCAKFLPCKRIIMAFLSASEIAVSISAVTAVSIFLQIVERINHIIM